MSDIKSLQLKVRDLPDDIRSWFASSRVIYTTESLNNYLNLQDERKAIIPRLILKLITHDLEPQDFATDLATELGITNNAAKAITKEVEAKLLHPIEESLRGAGIDIALLHFERELELPLLSNIGAISSTPSREPEYTAPAERLPEETERHIASPRPSTIIEPKGPAAPFILHEERETVKPIAQPPRPTFSIKIPLKEKKYGAVAPPVAARIETGEEKATSEGGETKFNIRLPEKVAPGSEERLLRLPRNDESLTLPRPPMGPLGQRISQNHESIEAQKQDGGKSPTTILPLVKGEEGGGFKIKLKPIMGEPRKPMANPLVAKVVNYTQWFTPLE